MTKHPLYGLGTALITPFKSDKTVDFDALEHLLDTQIKGNIDYIVVLGTTGESVTLSHEERQAVRKHIAQYVNGRMPLVLGVGGNNTAQVICDLKAMSDELIRNYSAILSVCPYYNKPTQEGLFYHFSAIAEACPIPIILYNVPGRTGVNMFPETVIRLHQAYPDKIIGVKEASGNIEQIKHLIALSQEFNSESKSAFLVISGDDGIACELMEAGAAGLISVASNAFADDFAQIVHHKNADLQKRYSKMIELLFAEGNPVGIKAVLSQKGIIANELRLPLVAASDRLQTQIANTLSLL